MPRSAVVAHLILVLILPIYTMMACSCNTRARQQAHLENRQALRERQRQAVLSGKSVRSVIETEMESETTQCPTWACVGRLAPRLKSQNETTYKRIDQIDQNEKEKPPFQVVVDSTSSKAMKSVKTKNGGSVKYSDIVSNDFDLSANSSRSYVSSMA
ncbi:hypothetical protein B9Z55_020561 [Caenorhabditis nigoni]|uniref:Uncharacterized protein n=2 Tax=Caenorhabditis nigoni TaxID=1611254 RepID=A0A2G5TNA1_9PELO|nr:hypothetical protein B9Z55_020561 [Caenorhabditis nigoni]